MVKQNHVYNQNDHQVVDQDSSFSNHSLDQVKDQLEVYLEGLMQRNVKFLENYLQMYLRNYLEQDCCSMIWELVIWEVQKVFLKNFKFFFFTINRLFFILKTILHLVSFIIKTCVIIWTLSFTNQFRVQLSSLLLLLFSNFTFIRTSIHLNIHTLIPSWRQTCSLPILIIFEWTVICL